MIRRILFSSLLEIIFHHEIVSRIKETCEEKSVRKKLLPIVANICNTAGIICATSNSNVQKFRPDLEKKRIIRIRRSIFEVLEQLGGPDDIRRAIRMTEDSFWNLTNILFKGNSYKDRKRGVAVGGDISNPCKLYIALCMFAGASVYDLSVIFGVHIGTIYNSLWYIVDVINDTSEFGIQSCRTRKDCSGF